MHSSFASIKSANGEDIAAISAQQLVAEVAALTGAPLPALLDRDAPVLQDAPSNGFYLVGLIGGKEVGKSALVNALVGEAVSESTAYGPGTEIAVAYAHHDQAAAVRELLEREAPKRFRVVPHKHEHLLRQVLLDLPDIDSLYADHVELTRRLLRHMLYPVWIQSVEKYADQQPQKLLAAVTAGNDPANFVFCLNKVDQLSANDAIDELRDDYAKRLARVAGRETSSVHMISAIRPDEFDLPLLREKLSQQKSSSAVTRSIELASRQRDRSMLTWIDSQQLPARTQRLARLQEEAEELTAARLAVPLLENGIPRILDDPAHQLSLVDEVMAARVARWPVLNILHTLLSPLTNLWRRNVGAAASPQALVENFAKTPDRALAPAVRSTFALLQQTNPAISDLYRRQKLWEDLPADMAAAELHRTLTATLERQRATAIARLTRSGPMGAVLRWVLTIGAILWFPIVQPILEIILQEGVGRIAQHSALLVVQLLSASSLQHSAAFLAVWFLVLWLILRWDTQRRVQKLVRQWRSADAAEPELSPAAATMAWIDDLLDPIRNARQRSDDLTKRTEGLRRSLAQ